MLISCSLGVSAQPNEIHSGLNIFVGVWMDSKELKHLKQQAEITGLSVGSLIRNLVAGVELRPHPPEAYAALLRELSAIGKNINQIA